MNDGSSTLPVWMKKFPDALARLRELVAQNEPLTIDTVLKAAQPFGLHQGATFVEFVGYVERETGLVESV